MQMQYTPAELERFSVRDGAGLAKDKKFLALLDKCEQQSNGR
jgi:hypothetical protein